MKKRTLLIIFVILYVLCFFFATRAKAQNVGINGSGSTPNSSAMLDIDVSALAAKRGLLIPRISSAEKTAMNPLPAAAQGLLVYQTDGLEGFYYNTSTSTTPNWVYLYNSSGNDIWTRNAPNVYLSSSSDYVGIGTSSPRGKLDIQFQSNSVEERALNIDYSTNGAGIGILADSTAAMIVKTHGNSSSDVFGAYFINTVTGTANTSGTYSRITGTSSGAKVGAATMIDGSGGKAGYTAYIRGSGNEHIGADFDIDGGLTNYGFKAIVANGSGGSGYGLYISGTPKYAAFLSSGVLYSKDNILVGYAPAYFNTTYMMDVNGKTNMTGPLFFNGVAGTTGYVLQSNGSAAAPTWVDPTLNDVWTDIGTGTIYNTSITGNVGIGTMSPVAKLEVCGNVRVVGTITAKAALVVSGGITCSSDIRFKKNIAPLENSLEKVLKMRGVSYNWKTDEFPENEFTSEKQIGFIAQELELLYPELVKTDEKGYKSVDYSRLTPILVEAIKSQQLLLEGQKDAIETLRNELNRLENELGTLKSIGKAN